MGTPAEPNVTRLLHSWRQGNERALDELLPLVYDQLHALASRYLHGERGGHTLQATALVHEAYLRLVGTDVNWEDRVHFFAVAARTMRRILVDHARSRLRDKRGGGAEKLSLEEAYMVGSEPTETLLEMDQALDRLAEMDSRKAQLVEFFYFGGLSYQEAASVLQISEATVHRELKMAKAWLYHELKS